MPKGTAVVLLVTLLGAAFAGLTEELEPTYIEIVLDASHSMTEAVPGGTKIEVARQAIKQLLDVLPSAYQVALRVYGHSVPQSDRARSCQDSELLWPLRPLTQENRAAIAQRLTLVQPKGLTPIAFVLEQAVNDFVGLQGKKVIVLVSDGEETCGGDPLAMANYITALGIGLKVYVVGFDVASREQLEGIALRAGGAYYDARNAIELGQALKQAVWAATSVLFFDDFEGELSPAWRTNPVGNTQLGIDGGRLTIVGGKQEDQLVTAWVGDPLWRNLILQVDLTYDQGSGYYGTLPWQRDHRLAFLFRVQDPNNLVGFFFQPGGECGFRVKRHGIWGELQGAGTAPELYAYRLTVVVEGGVFSAAINGELISSFSDDTFSRGYLGIQCMVDKGNRVYFDNFTVTPLE